MRFVPAPVGHGVRFVRTDLPGRPEVRVRPENAHFDPGTARRTILQQDGVQVHTMEHVLAAVAGLGIDNLIIETSTMEVPEGHDGSAAPIAKALMSAGFEDQDKPTRHIKVSKPVRWAEGKVELSAVPYSGLSHLVHDRVRPPAHRHPGTRPSTSRPNRSWPRSRRRARSCSSVTSSCCAQSGWIKGGRIESAIVVGKDRRPERGDAALSRTSSCATRSSTCSATCSSSAGRCWGTSARSAPGTRVTSRS